VPFREGAIRLDQSTRFATCVMGTPGRGDAARRGCGPFEDPPEKMFKIIFWRYDCHPVEDKAMSYPPKHKRDTREKILERAFSTAMVIPGSPSSKS